MGRAQGQTKDAFGIVIGSRRGVQSEHEGMSSAPLDNYPGSPFALDLASTERRILLLRWLLEEVTVFASARIDYILKENDVYDAEEDKQKCLEDLNSLIQQGVCWSDEVGEENTLYYAASLKDSWPLEHQRAYVEFFL